MALRKKAKANPTGFTLVELMIVVAIIGLLAAVAIPQFLNARNRADAKAKVGELVGIAKECATFNAEADQSTTTIQEPTGGQITCGGANPPVSLDLASRRFAAPTTVDCLGKTFSEATGVTIEVSGAGQMECEETQT
jgi:type IV pilus assembly protein PilA